MSKEKIIDIKSVQDFYKALRDEVANLFNGYEKCRIFDGWTEQQKKECFGFGTHILSIVYNPIQKRYTKQERKKYDKIIDNYEKICKEKARQIADLQSQLAITEKALELASETIKQMCSKPLWIGGNIPSPEPKDSKYFKDIAKEMLENE